MTPRYDFTRGFKASVADNSVWKSSVTHLTVRNWMELLVVKFFSESAGIAQSIRLPDHCSVAWMKVMAIQAAAGIIGDGKVSKRNITRLSDSQAAIEALSSNVMNFKTVYSCRRYLNKIGKQYRMGTGTQ